MREVFKRARLEKTFGYPQVSDLREMAGIGGPGEALAAWEFIQKFIDRHVEGDGRGGYMLRESTGPIQWRDGKAYAMRIPVPELPPAIDRAMRLCGGWSRFKESSDEEYTWLKKEFLAAMASYDSTEIASNRLLEGPAFDIVKQLSGAVKGLPGEVAKPKSASSRLRNGVKSGTKARATNAQRANSPRSPNRSPAIHVSQAKT